MKIIPLLLILLLSSCATTKTTWAYGSDNWYSRNIVTGKNSRLISQTSSKIDTANTKLEIEVIDEAKETIPFASVVLYKNKTQTAAGTTDMDGHLTFKQLPAGSYTFKVIFIGYSPLSDSIVIENGNAYKLKVELGYGGSRL